MMGVRMFDVRGCLMMQVASEAVYCNSGSCISLVISASLGVPLKDINVITTPAITTKSATPKPINIFFIMT